jgi:hypothetical protein
MATLSVRRGLYDAGRWSFSVTANLRESFTLAFVWPRWLYGADVATAPLGEMMREREPLIDALLCGVRAMLMVAFAIVVSAAVGVATEGACTAMHVLKEMRQ